MNFIVSQSYLILFEHLIDWPKQQGQLMVAIQKKEVDEDEDYKRVKEDYE
jgi:hypothetical protein